MDHYCMRCKKSLHGDEIALYRKLIYRDARDYLCLPCLSEDLRVTETKLRELIAYFHKSGICTLFAKYDD